MKTLYTTTLLFLVFLVGLSGLVLQGVKVSGENNEDSIVCIRNNPLVTVIPEARHALAGQTVYYNITVENMDVNCTSSVFNLTVATPDVNWRESYTANPLIINPGKVGKSVMSMQSPIYVANGTYLLNVTATNFNSTLKGNGLTLYIIP